VDVVELEWAGRLTAEAQPVDGDDCAADPADANARDTEKDAPQELPPLVEKAIASSRWWGWHWLVTVSGESSNPDSLESAPRKATWGVLVNPVAGTTNIARTVYRRDEKNPNWAEWTGDGSRNGGWKPEPVIWPTYGAPLTTSHHHGSDATTDALDLATPLGARVKYWSTASDRVRDSAKWMATVVGLALATLVGTSPLTDIRRTHGTSPWNIFFGVLGLTALAGTLLLLLQVIRPQATSYEDVQRAYRHTLGWRRFWTDPLVKWKETVESEQDLYLPAGVNNLTTLRQAAIIDEITLAALSNALTKETASERSTDIQKAQAACEARLREWQSAGARITSIAEYYRLHRKSGWATYLGSVLGLIGVVAVISAFVL
jgi:hypothetical protein